MSTEVKEKLEVAKKTIATRLEIPTEVHKKIMGHKYFLTGHKSESVTFAEAAIDLLDKVTCETTFKYSIGQLVWYRSNGEDPEQFKIEDRKLINGIPYYLVDGRYLSESLIS